MLCSVGENCRLLSSSAPGVHYGEHRSIGADLLDAWVVADGGAGGEGHVSPQGQGV